MSNSIHATQPVHAQTSTTQTANPTPKAPAPLPQSTTPQDKVTISSAAQQALANNTKAAPAGDTDHDGH